MAGVEIQASILQTLIDSSSRTNAAPSFYWIIIICTLLITSLIMFHLRPLGRVLIGFLAIFILLTISQLLFVFNRIWLPPVLPAAGCLLICGATLTDGFIMVNRQRAWIKKAFSRYISPEVVSLISAQPERLRLGGEEVEATIMFLDLAGFTTISEKLSPSEVILLLSELFAPMTNIIQNERGTLDKFIGDAIIAFWGAPLPQTGHALRACRTALAMQAQLTEMNEMISRRFATTVSARIGLHFGTLVVGNVGSKEHYNYTCLGDTVNLASRLESANKIYGTSILISGKTAEQVSTTFLTRQLDQLQVKGRNEPTVVFELLEKTSVYSAKYLDLFEQARTSYYQRDYSTAIALLAPILESQPQDQPSRKLLERCRQFLKEPPPSTWDGIWPPDTS